MRTFIVAFTLLVSQQHNLMPDSAHTSALLGNLLIVGALWSVIQDLKELLK